MWTILLNHRAGLFPAFPSRHAAATWLRDTGRTSDQRHRYTIVRERD